MRLREHTVHVRLATLEDVLDDGRYLQTLRAFEAFAGATYGRMRDLVGVRLPFHDIDGADDPLVGGYVGVGLHQRARFRLESDDPALPSVELHANSHPYSGRHVTGLDARFGHALVGDAAGIAAFEALVRDVVTAWAPLWAHAHDTDDLAIQNCESVDMLRLGFGVEATEDELADRPGREWARGEFRYHASWISYYGAEVCEKLTGHAADGALAAGEPLAGGRWFRLFDDPLAAADDRDAQRAHRDAIGYERLAAKERWTHGYWQRRT